jgi:hypothetical protein
LKEMLKKLMDRIWNGQPTFGLYMRS